MNKDRRREFKDGENLKKWHEIKKILEVLAGERNTH